MSKTPLLSNYRAYAPHQDFVAPARRAALLFQTIVGFVAIEFLYGIARDLIDGGLAAVLPGRGDAYEVRSEPLPLILDLFGFVALALLVVWVAWRSHDRPGLSVIGPLDEAAAMFLRATCALIIFYICMDVFSPLWGDADLFEQRPLGPWLGWLPMALIAILVQTGAEEMFYRGYLQQQIAARFASPLVWMVVPNLAFAAVHWFNGETYEDSWRYVIWAFFFGVAASDLVARTGNLGAAVGFHMVNNMYAFLVLAERDAPDSGLALYLAPPGYLGGGAVDPEELTNAAPNSPDMAPDMGAPILDLALGFELAVLAVAWLVVRVAIRR